MISMKSNGVRYVIGPWIHKRVLWVKENNNTNVKIKSPENKIPDYEGLYPT